MNKKIWFILLPIFLYFNIVFSLSGSGTVGDPYIIYDVNDLQSIDSGDLSAYYKLGNNIDASSTSSWNGGTGFKPIGNGSYPFTGEIDGDCYNITDLYMNNPTMEQYTSLIEKLGVGGVIKNLGLVDVYISGSLSGLGYTASLVGINNGLITNSFATGEVFGTDYSAGLVSWNNDDGVINNTFFIGNIDKSRTHINCYFGGLVGMNRGMINRSYTDGVIDADIQSGYSISAGGFVTVNRGIISQCFSMMDVGKIASGFTRQNAGGYIYDSFCNGTVENGESFIYYNEGGDYQPPSYIIRCYSASPVTGTDNGFVGVQNCKPFQNCIQYSYYDSNIVSSDGATPKTTSEMKQESTFVTWDFTDVWEIQEDVTYPYFNFNYCWTHEVEEAYYCGELGICTANVWCFLESSLQYIIDMIYCLTPMFWLIFGVAIAGILLLGMKSLSKNF